MEVGIVSFGAYIPMQRMQRKLIGDTWEIRVAAVRRPLRTGTRTVSPWPSRHASIACAEGAGMQTASCSLRPRHRTGRNSPLPSCEKCSISGRNASPWMQPTPCGAGRRCSGRPWTWRGHHRGRPTSQRRRISACRRPLRPWSWLSVTARPPSSSERRRHRPGQCPSQLLVGIHRSLEEDKDTYTQIWEDRYVLSEGYEKILGESLATFLASLNAAPGDYARAAVSAPGAGALRAYVGKQGSHTARKSRDNSSIRSVTPGRLRR